MFRKSTLADDPLDVLSPALWKFSEAIFDAFDVQAVVTVPEAARIAGLSETTVKQYIDQLKALKCWPYRSSKWRWERKQPAAASTVA